VPNLKKIDTSMFKLVILVKISKYKKLKVDIWNNSMEMVMHQKKHQNNILYVSNASRKKLTL